MTRSQKFKIQADERHQAALREFVTQKCRFDDLLAELQAASENHFDRHPDDVTWADAETAKSFAYQLSQLADRVLSRGEYDPKNCEAA